MILNIFILKSDEIISAYIMFIGKYKKKHDIKIYFYNFFSNKQKDFEEVYLVITTAQFIEWCYCETNYSEYLHVNK